MRSLFLRIFLSFWAAQALFLVLAILVTIAMRPARRGIESQGLQILAEAVNAYQSAGENGARDYLEDLLHTQHVRAFVFDPAGYELAGRQVPPWIEDVRQGRPPHGGVPHGGFPHHHGWMDSLLPDRIFRQALTLDGKRYTVVLELPPGPRVFFGPHEIPGLGITIAIISSGLICYLLAWSMTSPVTRLRKAAQSLAAGDLSARTGAAVRGRHDEMRRVRGVFFMPVMVEDVVRAFPEVDEFQSSLRTIEDLDTVVVQIEPRRDVPAERHGELAERIGKALEQRLSLAPVVEIAATGSLPRFEMKARRFHDERTGAATPS